MTIHVHLFAILREKAGVSQSVLVLKDGATVRDAADTLLTQFPVLRPYISAVRFAVDREYASLDTHLTEGCELALIPPVSGG